MLHVDAIVMVAKQTRAVIGAHTSLVKFTLQASIPRTLATLQRKRRANLETEADAAGDDGQNPDCESSRARDPAGAPS